MNTESKPEKLAAKAKAAEDKALARWFNGILQPHMPVGTDMNTEPKPESKTPADLLKVAGQRWIEVHRDNNDTSNATSSVKDEADADLDEALLVFSPFDLPEAFELWTDDDDSLIPCDPVLGVKITFASGVVMMIPTFTDPYKLNP